MKNSFPIQTKDYRCVTAWFWGDEKDCASINKQLLPQTAHHPFTTWKCPCHRPVPRLHLLMLLMRPRCTYSKLEQTKRTGRGWRVQVCRKNRAFLTLGFREFKPLSPETTAPVSRHATLQPSRLSLSVNGKMPRRKFSMGKILGRGWGGGNRQQGRRIIG